VLLSAAALALGLVGSAGLSLVALRRERLRFPIVAAASVVQTIPSLALLALFYPALLLASSIAKRVFGVGFSALGFLPSLAALSLYSMLPIVRGFVTGLAQVDPDVLEAADGAGMTPFQRLIHVELPLAAPVILAGIRTSAVWVIGTATLATPVGQTSLGNYVFSGLQTEDWVLVLFGCGAAALLALHVDLLLWAIESGIARRSRVRIALGGAGLLLGVCLAAWPARHGAGRAYLIGAKNFTEQFVLSALLAGRLERQGATVERRVGLGSMIAFRAVSRGDLDAYVDYSGTLWTNVLGKKDHPPRKRLLDEMTRLLASEYHVTVLGELGFENAYALAMREDRAEALGITSIADLAARSPELVIGGDFEFFARPEWEALRRTYALSFRKQRQFQSTFLYGAVDSGEVDVISAFSSDGRIAALGLRVLDDPDHAIFPYDAVLLVSERRADDPLVRAAFEPLLGHVSIEMMRTANMMVDRAEGKVAPIAAAGFLARGLGLGAAPAPPTAP
jgi:osmoprotectant transport system permease protein